MLVQDALESCGSPRGVLQRDLAIAARELLIKLRFWIARVLSLNAACRNCFRSRGELEILQPFLFGRDVDSLNERRKIQRHRRLGLLKNDQLLIDGAHQDEASPVVRGKGRFELVGWQLANAQFDGANQTLVEQSHKIILK